MNEPCDECLYIFDIHFEGDITHIWSRDLRGKLQHHPLAFHPIVYVAEDRADTQFANVQFPRSLAEIASDLKLHPDIVTVEEVSRHLSSKHDSPTQVLRIQVRSPTRLPDLVLDLKNRRYNMYNVDLNSRQQFFLDTKSYPLGACHIQTEKVGADSIDLPDGSVKLVSIEMHDDYTGIMYKQPALVMMEIVVDINHAGTFPTFEDPIDKLTLNLSYHYGDIFETVTTEGTEAEQLLQLVEYIRSYDPDVLNVLNGDKFLLNYLAHRAAYHELTSDFILGRLSLPHYPRKTAEGQTYMTYGQIMRRDPVWYIPGRIHLDAENSFFMYESGFAGLIDLCRMGGAVPERTSRASIGAALTGIEFHINATTQPPTLVPPAKADGEQFKSAEGLLIADNGGLIYPAKPGVYDRVWAIDFTSLYPFIMARHNIGNETVLCSHQECAENGPHRISVPEVNYHVCHKRIGVVPRTMNLVLKKRLSLKLLRKYDIDDKEKKRFKGVDSALKWILVSCFEGSTGVLIKKNGEYLTERLDRVVNDFSQDERLEALGMNRGGLPEFKLVRNVIKIRPTTPTYRIQFRGGKAVIATADHLWPVKTDDGWMNIRTDELTKDHDIPQLSGLDFDPSEDHTRLIRALSSSRAVFTGISEITRLSEPPEYVYCLQLDSPDPWFMIQGSVITHNCFGYLGFKNARWGSIESHQCVTAWARIYLRDARAICESHNFEVVAGITDSLFIRAKDPDDDNPRAIRRIVKDITYSSGIPIDTEGRFNWVVFCNIREYNEVAALNRYFGYFDHGEFKLRGIKHRQRRACQLEKDFQEAILEVFGGVETTEEFKKLIPVANQVLIEWKEKLRRREIDPQDLVIKLKSHKGADGYKATSTVQALTVKKYQEQGRDIKAGQSFFYLVADDSVKTTDRIVIGPNVDSSTLYDIDFYCAMVEDNFFELLEAPQLMLFEEIVYEGDPLGTVRKLGKYFNEGTTGESVTTKSDRISLASYF